MAWRYIESDAGVTCCFIAEHLETGGRMVAPFSVVHLDGTPSHVACIVIETPPGELTKPTAGRFYAPSAGRGSLLISRLDRFAQFLLRFVFPG